MTTRTGLPRPRVAVAVEALDTYLAGSGDTRPTPPLRYLRRKPGRGLVAVFGPDGQGDVFTVTADEAAVLAGVGAAGAALTVRRFPDDPRLPELRAVMTPAAHPGLATALEDAARRVSDVPRDHELREVTAAAVRYKPGDRCVVRYRLLFGPPPGADGPGTTSCTVVAKLYREPAEAQAAQDLLVRLRAGGGAAWTARALGVVPGLPLALTEDLGSGRTRPPARSGLAVVHPGPGPALDVVRRAAEALAELHTSGVDSGGLKVRTAVQEAGKAAGRARTLEGHVPQLAEQVRRAGAAVCAALEALPGDTLRPGHGSYKSSQLLVRDGSVFLVDFDQFCLADPALDVGYFLAYLRPAGLWYRRAGRRAWFDDAARTFVDSYLRRLAERGETPQTGEGIARRAPVYEAALLLKIGARRANRLHDPRPGEVAAVLDEISRCVAGAGAGAGAGVEDVDAVAGTRAPAPA